MVDTIETIDDILAHHGVKGMKWGQRRAEKKSAKADAKWEKSIYSMKGAVAVHNHVADQMNGPGGILDRLNNQSKYKDKNLYDNPKLEKSYYKEYTQHADKAYGNAVRAVHGSSPSGKKRAVYIPGENARIEIRDVNVSHADSTEPDLVIQLKLDVNGQVVEANQAEQAVAHSDTVETVDDVLAHHGVKGMKWGVRRDRPSSVTVSSSPGKKAKAKGGHNLPAHEDAINAVISRQRVKSSSVHALSNDELKTLVDRMNLESQYSKLSSQNRSAGAKFASSLLGDAGKQQAKKVTNDFAAKKVASVLAGFA